MYFCLKTELENDQLGDASAKSRIVSSSRALLLVAATWRLRAALSIQQAQQPRRQARQNQRFARECAALPMSKP